MDLVEKLRNLENDSVVTVGFDGYIDTIIRVLKNNGSSGNEYFQTMKSFGEYIIEKSHKSCSLELRVVKEKSGGNMPIFSKALSRLGVALNCIGAMGMPELHPLFKELGEKCKPYSVSNPGTCQALEFEDGKLMLARNEEIETLDFKRLTDRLPVKEIIEMVNQSDLLTFLNWSEMKGSTSIWKGFLEEIIPHTNRERQRKLFIDLSDCSHRTQDEILGMVELIQRFSAYVGVVISLNRNEAEKVASSIGIENSNMEEMSKGLYEKIKCETLIIHLVDSSYCIENQQALCVKNRYVEKPKLLTGGGDNFNAGFVYGYLNGLQTEESLVVANAVSGYYVTHGHSPSKEQLLAWLSE